MHTQRLRATHSTDANVVPKRGAQCTDDDSSRRCDALCCVPVCHRVFVFVCTGAAMILMRIWFFLSSVVAFDLSRQFCCMPFIRVVIVVELCCAWCVSVPFWILALCVCVWEREPMFAEQRHLVSAFFVFLSFRITLNPLHSLELSFSILFSSIGLHV